MRPADPRQRVHVRELLRLATNPDEEIEPEPARAKRVEFLQRRRKTRSTEGRPRISRFPNHLKESP